MSRDYPHIATSLREEAARNRKTLRYLTAISELQDKTAGYIDKQFGRGELDLCEGAIDGLLKMMQHPGDIATLYFAAFGRGKVGEVGYRD
jgi:hypothetical protein